MFVLSRHFRALCGKIKATQTHALSAFKPMLKCPQCGREFPPDASVCPDDGSTLRADATVSEDALEALPTPAPDPLLGVVLDDKYRLDERLGEGGMGAVY